MAMVGILLTATAIGANPTAYEMIERYDFPRGILPQGVHDYELQLDGSFEVHFSGECSFRIAGYDIHYSSRIAGHIQNDTISGLEGVKVKIWIPLISIREVRRDGNELRLHAGAVSKSFLVDVFSTSPRCN